MLKDSFDRLATEAGSLCKINKRKTLTAIDVQSATRLLLYTDQPLAVYAVRAGAQAVVKFFEHQPRQGFVKMVLDQESKYQESNRG